MYCPNIDLSSSKKFSKKSNLKLKTKEVPYKLSLKNIQFKNLHILVHCQKIFSLANCWAKVHFKYIFFVYFSRKKIEFSTEIFI